MAGETIFQSPVLTDFVYPFLLVFFIVFAILEKTKLLGDEKKQLNALVAFVIGLIFVSAVFPKMVVGNMILFLTVALVIMFVVLLLWGFAFGSIKDGFKIENWMKGVLGVIIGIAVLVSVFWITGIGDKVLGLLFNQSWSNAFWTNLSFIVLIAIALGLVLKNTK